MYDINAQYHKDELAKKELLVDLVKVLKLTEQEIINVNDSIKNLISPNPILPAVTIRVNAITTGAYVATNEVNVTGRKLLNVDFIITDGGTLANNGKIIAILEASDDNVNWVSVHNVAVTGNLHQDGAGNPYEAGTVFRNMVAEIPAYAIPYDSANPPVNPIRVTFATGYGRYYRFQVRASVPSGIQGGAPATFPDLEITATLQ